MKRKYTEEELSSFMNPDVMHDGSTLVEVAAELHRMYNLKGSFMARGYHINRLGNDLAKIRKEKAVLSRQLDILLNVEKGKSLTSIAEQLARSKSDNKYLEDMNTLQDRIVRVAEKRELKEKLNSTPTCEVLK